MRRAMYSICIVILAACSVTGSSLAALKEVEKGVFVEDFEGGYPDQLRVDAKATGQKVVLPEVLKIEKENGRAVLHLKGGGFHNRVYYQDRKFKDFTLEVRMKKTAGSYAGIVVREHWRVYFQMRGYLAINSELPELQSKGELFKSGEEFKGYHELKVVCAGPLLHVYVDDQPLVTYRIPAGEGRIGFYSHGGGEAFYDDLRIDTRVAPEHYVLVEPEAPDGALVFPPETPVALKAKISNFSDSAKQVAVAASVRTWSGQAVKQEIRQEVTAGLNAESVAEFDVGRISAGFYRVDLQASCDGKQVSKADDLPLAVQPRGSGQFKAPTLPVGAYYKSVPLTLEPGGGQLLAMDVTMKPQKKK